MSDQFFAHPILNSPYEYPSRHWELDEGGQPTQKIAENRRAVDFITPIPKAKKRKKNADQGEFVMDEGKGLSSKDQQYQMVDTINRLRKHVDDWRKIPDSTQWKVTPETARLLQHWRHHNFTGLKPFFCQIEAVETLIWLTEVAPQMGKKGSTFLEHLDSANGEANPELMRLALKLATGAGKTTVMAMIIAWQTINAARRPNSKRFSRGFLIVAPGITIKERLRVLQPHDPDSYYKERDLVPQELLPEIERAKIVITNYHAFKLRERMDLSVGGRALLKGRRGGELNTLESEGQMLQRVLPELMGLKNILVINDEAHHCYREKQTTDEEGDLKGDDKKEAESNKEAARLWISGLEAANRNLGVARVVDLSATPFFLRGSGYAEGTLFPWTMSDFSLMDAIECGIVKLPRVPVADNIPGAEMPVFRELWEHVGKDLPKSARGASSFDPLALPTKLKTAIDALYGHYEKTYRLWEDAGIKVPPCFIIVCQNTSISKLVYDYISGFERENEDGSSEVMNGSLELFRNYNGYGLVVHAPPLYIQEKVHPKVLIDDLKKMSVEKEPADDQMDMFGDFNGIPEGAEKTEFYEYDQNWSNRMILGDSLAVMASLAEREALRGKVQCIYFDPPYGIKFNSNFQWSTTDNKSKGDKQDQITREPEQVKAFRDTWRDGIHSYMTYLRDRLTVARDLLTDSGSIFVQIGDENVHRVRALMDEVFGEDNCIGTIWFRKKTMPLGAKYLEGMGDYIVWAAKDSKNLKFRRLYKAIDIAGDFHWNWRQVDDVERKKYGKSELEKNPAGDPFRLVSMWPPSFSEKDVYALQFNGKQWLPSSGQCYPSGGEKLDRVIKANRLVVCRACPATC